MLQLRVLGIGHKVGLSGQGLLHLQMCPPPSTGLCSMRSPRRALEITQASFFFRRMNHKEVEESPQFIQPVECST